MAPAKTPVPAVEGWFTLDPERPALLGSRCTSCGNYAFPKETFYCRNPHCQGRYFDEVELSRTGRIWSYTDARYQPPPPYVPTTDPYKPFAIAAVELAEEKMVVMGQLVPAVGVDDVSVGTEVELTLDTLYEDDEHRYLVWKWRPLEGVGAADPAGAGHATDSGTTSG
jgi:uncharacterized OB-fold protein